MFRVSLSCAVDRVALELGREQRLAFVAMAGLVAVVDRFVDMAVGLRMVRTAPRVGNSCSAFQEDLDQLVASVLWRANLAAGSCFPNSNSHSQLVSTRYLSLRLQKLHSIYSGLFLL